ncbi:MAG: winged helix-turn-helix domain-containing protein [Myxococcota bacterium]
MALVVVVACEAGSVASEWLTFLRSQGHVVKRLDPASLPPRPRVLDAVVVAPNGDVASIARWAGSDVMVRMMNGPPDDRWLLPIGQRRGAMLHLGKGHVDLRDGAVVQEGHRIPLTATETRLLAWLAMHEGTVVTRAELLENVWSYNARSRTRVVDVTMARLRAKIEADPSKPCCLVTVHGLGYRLDGLPRLAEFRPTDTLVGRDATWTDLARALASASGPITLLGPAGIGKTALARAFASSVPGAIWCALDGTTTPEEAIAEMARVLGLHPTVGSDGVREALTLGDHSLVVLDNAEQVSSALLEVLSPPPHVQDGPLKDRSTSIAPVLVTSRVRLGLPIELCIEVPPLTSDASSRLLQARVNAQRPGLVIDDETLATLVERCEGIPLAIELAASHTRILSPPDLLRVWANAVEDRYDAALNASWTLLDHDVRQTLARLAFFPGDVSFRLAQELVEDPLEVLGALQDASLLKMLPSAYGSAVHLLDSVRSFVRRTAPVARQPSLDLARAVARVAITLDEEARGPRAWAAVHELNRLRGPVLAVLPLALDEGEYGLATDLGLALTHAFEVFGSSRSDITRMEALAQGPGMPHAVRVAELLTLLCMRHGRVEDARRYAERAVQLARTKGDRARAAHARARVAYRTDELDTSELEARLPDFETSIEEVRARFALGIAYRKRREVERSVQMFEKALAIADRLQIGWLIANALGLLASGYSARGEHERASRLAEQASQNYRDAGVHQLCITFIALRAMALRWLGEIELAQALHEEAIAAYLGQGQRWTAAAMCVGLSELHVDQGSPDDALEAARKAIRLVRACDDPVGLERARLAEATAELSRGSVVPSRRIASELLTSRSLEVRDKAAETAVLASLTLDEPEEGLRFGTQFALSEHYADFLRALVAAYQGERVTPPVKALPYDYQNAWRQLLGADIDHEANTPRGIAICQTSHDGRFPETALIRTMVERGRLPGSKV